MKAILLLGIFILVVGKCYNAEIGPGSRIVDAEGKKGC